MQVIKEQKQKEKEILYGKTPIMIDFAGHKHFKVQEERDDRPEPFIADYTPQGQMTIGWDRTMQPYEEPKQIPETQVALSANIVNNLGSKDDYTVITGRMLQAGESESLSPLVEDNMFWMEDSDRSEMVRMMLFDALSVRMIRDLDSEEVSDAIDFKWDILNYSKNFITLQVDYGNPEDVGNFASKDYI